MVDPLKAYLDSIVKPKVTTELGNETKEDPRSKYAEKATPPNTPVFNPTPQEKINKQVSADPTAIFNSLKKTETKVERQKTPVGVEYEEYVPSKIRFMKSLPRYEMKHKDHSGLIVAKECLRKYFYTNVLCLVPDEDTNIFYPWGTAYHIFREKLTEYYGYGDDEPKIFDMERAKEAYKKAGREGMEHWLLNGEDQKAGSKYDWFTADRLFASFKKSFEHWEVERRRGIIKVIGIEQYFVVELIDGRFVQGRFDETILINGVLWGRDYKTTSKPEVWFSKQLHPNNQVRTYTFANGKLAGRQAKGIVIQAMYNGKSTKQGPKGPEVYEKSIECTEDELKQWETEQAHWNRILQLCRDHDVWPQSEVNCQWCPYHRVCQKPTENSMVFELENKYVLKLRNPARTEDSDN